MDCPEAIPDQHLRSDKGVLTVSRVPTMCFHRSEGGLVPVRVGELPCRRGLGQAIWEEYGLQLESETQRVPETEGDG